MGERKVIQKYYPPDFDPSLIPRGKRPKNEQIKVRMMMPMSVRCNSCGEYLYRGKKFNSRKETVTGEEYHGVKIFRFYMHCTNCATEFTIKTDPANSDYVAEMNCSRNFEGWREKQDHVDAAKKERAAEEENDPMKQLENRTLDSKIEMDIIEALDEIRALNSKKLDPALVNEYYKSQYEQKIKQFDDEEAAEIAGVSFKSAPDYVKRLEASSSESDEGETEETLEAPKPVEEKKEKKEKKKPQDQGMKRNRLTFDVGQEEEPDVKREPIVEEITSAAPVRFEEKPAVVEVEEPQDISQAKVKEEEVKEEKPKATTSNEPSLLPSNFLSTKATTAPKKVTVKPVVKIVAKKAAAPVKKSLVDY
ncbi:coiled-coil domain-containing protein [Planoprotostelium fungivorum]|uniref:Splicing factor YJU2 n=1 Tax=Planoprotostelium fungivorum TaxID=1890364 RepID=A0A2P6MQ53_9EUKA|nr:coiled-coil domain-containing protein [Planoprotostelium fungivorum]